MWLTDRRHFWGDGENAHDSIEIATNLGPQLCTEDVVRAIWNDLLRVYFPDHLQGRAGVKYRVQTGAYRGPPGKEGETKPDVVVTQLATSQPGVPPTKRDILWVQCGTPDPENQPRGWNRMMKEAVNRLTVAHPTRSVYLLLANGIQWMLFEWIPGNLRSPLQFCAHSSSVTWTVHPQIHLVPLAGTSYLARTDPNGHFDQIDTRGAYSLDFWTMDPTEQRPFNLSALLHLEDCLAHIQAAAYTGGPNPAHFHS